MSTLGEHSLAERQRLSRGSWWHHHRSSWAVDGQLRCDLASDLASVIMLYRVTGGPQLRYHLFRSRQALVVNVIRIPRYEAETITARAGTFDVDTLVSFFLVWDAHLAGALTVIALEPVLVGVVAWTVNVDTLAHQSSFPLAITGAASHAESQVIPFLWRRLGAATSGAFESKRSLTLKSQVQALVQQESAATT
jgi:hypothetical protein